MLLLVFVRRVEVYKIVMSALGPGRGSALGMGSALGGQVGIRFHIDLSFSFVIII